MYRYMKGRKQPNYWSTKCTEILKICLDKVQKTER